MAAAVATAAVGPPNRPAPCFLLSLHWNHEKNKMAADSLASLGRRTDARGECSGPAGTSLGAIGHAGRGRGLEEKGAESERGQGAEAVESEAHARILPPNELSK